MNEHERDIVSRIISEAGERGQQIRKENTWLRMFIKYKVFDETYLKRLQCVHLEMVEEKGFYWADVRRTLHSVENQGEEIYVARIPYPGERGVNGSGFNMVFNSSQKHLDVSEFVQDSYFDLCQQEDKEEIIIPINVLMATYYFSGDDLFRRGHREDEQCNQLKRQVHGGIDLIKRGRAAFFKLEFPRLPEESSQSLHS